MSDLLHITPPAANRPRPPAFETEVASILGQL